jgi:hypothetical protein
MSRAQIQYIRTIDASRSANIASSTNATPIVATRTASTALTVSAATNKIPIEITTTVAHGLKKGDVVTGASVGGNTNANGDFRVIPVSLFAVQLYHPTTNAPIAGNAAWTSGGTLTPWKFQDGDIVVGAAHVTNTALNATWVTSSSSATVQTLKGRHDLSNSVGNGVGGATGTLAHSGQAYSPSLDISGINKAQVPVSLTVRVNFLTVGKRARISIHDTVDAFVNYLPILSFDVVGGISQTAPFYYIAPAREISSGRFGVASAKLRLHVVTESGSEIEYDAFLEY